MKIRFKNAKILTMKDRDIIEGELWVEDDKITYVGPSCSSDQTFDKEIDCGRDLLMPGLKDAHTHTAMTFARSLADNYQLDDWLHKAIFPIEGKLTAEHIDAFYRLGVAEYLKGGVTSCFDMYFQAKATADAAKKIGFRHVFCGSVNDFGGLDRLEDEFDTYNSYDPLISYVLGFHAEYTTSRDKMERISQIAHDRKAPVYAHISETRAEVAGCVERYGVTPVVLFDQIGLFDFGGGGFHCVHFSEEDRKIFKKKGLFLVFNACSNLKLASGIAPVASYIREGQKIAVGTDGAGSNNALSMFREMYLDTVLSNVSEDDAASVDPFEILKAATVGGAECMGLTDCDVLEAGKQADIIRIDMSCPCMQPLNNIANNIVYSGDTSIVKMTMIAGKILYEDGKFNTIDISGVYDRCNGYMRELI
ncbi:MAG: amidohydrolase [Clostridiales bacterium]|nr:amidohydrolase [Clostridiales bacterium]